MHLPGEIVLCSVLAYVGKHLLRLQNDDAHVSDCFYAPY